ncbi:hypothetical protein EV182_001379 [Spiromyces aspiralis]|uniref:Uncharacterized protein n=1 Tax=Spiromyces aspiralis TaxID=68401 RepID=A0ACC1HFZ3_9FUNG|nr:hypothetical protein EV182_001379 [Spiromyces aspiralis]
MIARMVPSRYMQTRSTSIAARSTSNTKRKAEAANYIPGLESIDHSGSSKRPRVAVTAATAVNATSSSRAQTRPTATTPATKPVSAAYSTRRSAAANNKILAKQDPGPGSPNSQAGPRHKRPAPDPESDPPRRYSKRLRSKVQLQGDASECNDGIEDSADEQAHLTSAEHASLKGGADPSAKFEGASQAFTDDPIVAYNHYLQWALVDARATKQFELAAKSIQSGLHNENQRIISLRRELAEKQTKLEVLRETLALQTWLADNKPLLRDMSKAISDVGSMYDHFAVLIADTARALPISNVHIESMEALVEELEAFSDAIRSLIFSGDDGEKVNGVFELAGLLCEYYRDIKHEADLLKECGILKDACEQESALLISRSLYD